MRACLEVYRIILALAVSAGLSAGSRPGQGALNFDIMETAYGQMPKDTGLRAMEVSPDGRHLALAFSRDKKFHLVVDGKEVETALEGVNRLIWAPDGSRLAFDVNRGGSPGVLIGTLAPTGAWKTEEAGAGYQFIGDIVFDPSGRRLAFIGVKEKKNRLVVDGREGPPHDAVWYPKFSPDGTRVAYVARTGKLWTLVLDGREGSSAYDSIMEHHFSADGKHHAFIAQRERKMLVSLDGKDGKAYDAVNALAVRPDGRQVAFRASEGGANYLVFEGDGGRDLRDIDPGMIAWSNEAKPSFAYWAKSGDGYACVIDNQPQKKYPSVSGLIFSRDGRRLLYVAGGTTNHAVVADRGTDGLWTSRDWPEIPGYIYKMPLFSPDGKRVAWGLGDKGPIGVDGTALSDIKFDFYIGAPIFDRPDRLNVIVRRGDDFRLVEIVFK